MIVVAVSAGIDSMVLLDYLYQQNYKIVIAHVNYQKREDSYLDALTIKEFIKGKDILFEELIVTKEMYNSENFQAQARRIRYQFFEEVAKKYQTNQVFVAHHRDDFLETFLFKKNRKGLYDYYGIKSETTYGNLIVKRPLLDMYKEDIEKYAQKNNIPFHEDSSNRTLDYTRNKLRAYLNNLSVDEKEALYQNAMLLNEEIAKEIVFVKKYDTNILEVKIFEKWSQDIKRRWFFFQISKFDITIKHLDDIINKIQYSKSFKVTFLDTTIIKAYDIIYILDNLLEPYSIKITTKSDYNRFVEEWQNKYNYKVKKVEVEYPFIIRNYRQEDFRSLKMDYKKFRLKIKKNKIPFFLRDYLPVIEKDGKVIQFIF